MDWPEIAGDPRFFQRAGPHTLAAIADAAGGEAPPRRLRLTGVAPLQTAGPTEVSFLDNRKYAAGAGSQPGRRGDRPSGHGLPGPGTAVPIVTDEPYVAWAKVAALFHPLPPVRPGIHPAAVVDTGRADRPERGNRSSGGDRRRVRRSARAAASAPSP